MQTFNLGAKKQSIELGGMELAAFSGPVDQALIPSPAVLFNYQGRQPGAAWRKAAQKRIERIRKADLRLSVTRHGRPWAGTPVRVSMQRHLFGFGTAVNAALITPASPSPYMEHIQKLFNKAVLENHLKWGHWSADSVSVATTAIDWLNSRRIPVRGHVLVWPSWVFMPSHVSRSDPALLQRQISDHIDEAARLFEGKLPEWDVANETFTQYEAINLIGENAVPSWFRRAREKMPGVKLYINDYDILSANDVGHREYYFNQIRDLVRQDVPIDGIGMQSHFGCTPTPPAEVLKRLDRYAKLGLEIQSTEFDVSMTDERRQADYTRDFMTAIFSHPAVTGFLMWGFWEGAHYSPVCAMYQRDWTEKPNGKVYRDLVFGKWWTDAKTRTDSRGSCAVSGYKGIYRVRIDSGTARRDYDIMLDTDCSLRIDGDNDCALIQKKRPSARGRPEPSPLVVTRGNATITFTPAGRGASPWALHIFSPDNGSICRWETKGKEPVAWDAARAQPGIYRAEFSQGRRRLTIVIPIRG